MINNHSLQFESSWNIMYDIFNARDQADERLPAGMIWLYPSV